MGPKDEGAGRGGRGGALEGASPAGDEPLDLEAERVPLAPARRRLALPFAAALTMDLIQWVLMPLFLAGAASPWNDALDVLTAAFLVRVLGWHWAFLPTFVVELIPVVDLVPTWTLAVWIATRAPKR